MTNPTANNLYSVANAISSSTTFVDIIESRAPTSYDNQYQTQKKWLDTSTERLWMLESFTPTSSVILANWVLVGSSSLIETLTGNSGGAVGPDTSQNINTLGDAVGITVTGNPSTNTLTWSLIGGGVAIQSVDVDAHTSPGTDPIVANATGQIIITGAQVAAGTTTNVIRTDSLAANSCTIEIQRSQAVSSSTVGDNGVCHFSDSYFTVDANGFVTLKNSTAFNYTQISHSDSPYVVLSTDYYISCDATAGTITIQLPNSPTTYQMYIIKDRTGKASTNNITVTTVGGVVLIDGSASYVLAGNFDSINLIFNGTGYEVW